MNAKPHYGQVRGSRYVPSWSVLTAPLDRVIEKYADKPKAKGTKQ